MNRFISAGILMSSFLFSLPAWGQAAYQSQGATGVFGRSSYRTNNYRRPDSVQTRSQRIGSLPATGFGRTAGVYGRSGRNGLPPTRLDSFVLNAGGHAAHIYGDEGVTLPPYEEFTKVHRINIGIMGDRDAGLTTGHGSYMPDAWGGDEFVDGPEFSQSGANGGNARHFSQGQYLGADPRQTLSGSGSGAGSLPPSPGDGYQPAYQHGMFVGYYSPQEVALFQSDPRAALRSFANSDRYVGGEGGRRSILYEIGDIPSPF